jgi:hypothetical protein
MYKTCMDSTQLVLSQEPVHKLVVENLALHLLTDSTGEEPETNPKYRLALNVCEARHWTPFVYLCM